MQSRFWRRWRDEETEGAFPLHRQLLSEPDGRGVGEGTQGHTIEAYSAGIETHGLNPRAVKVMAEAGVDISQHRSKHVDELKDVAFDVVVTVCGHANESCPHVAGPQDKDRACRL